MQKEVFDVQICLSQEMHVLGYLKTSEEKKQVLYNYIFQFNSQLEWQCYMEMKMFKNVTHANF